MRCLKCGSSFLVSNAMKCPACGLSTMTDSIYTIDDNPGYMYRNGYGVEQNYEEAVKWYRLAEEQGHTDAGKRIAKLIELGYVAD